MLREGRGRGGRGGVNRLYILPGERNSMKEYIRFPVLSEVEIKTVRGRKQDSRRVIELHRKHAAASSPLPAICKTDVW